MLDLAALAHQAHRPNLSQPESAASLADAVIASGFPLAVRMQATALGRRPRVLVHLGAVEWDLQPRGALAAAERLLAAAVEIPLDGGRPGVQALALELVAMQLQATTKEARRRAAFHLRSAH